MIESQNVKKEEEKSATFMQVEVAQFQTKKFIIIGSGSQASTLPLVCVNTKGSACFPSRGTQLFLHVFNQM